MREPIDRMIGERVLLARRRRGLSQEALAAQTTIARSVIARLERGKQTVSAERLKALARALGVSADYLLGLADDKRDEEAA